MTRLLAVPLDASDVFLMTFMILQDSYMEPTRVGSDSLLFNGFLICTREQLKNKKVQVSLMAAPELIVLV